jgi:putative transposase
MLERDVLVSYETVCRWALKFGPAYAQRLRRKTPSCRDVWRLDSSPHRIAEWKTVDNVAA